jgi:hypothetical protein
MIIDFSKIEEPKPFFDFKECLKWSEEESRKPYWLDVYKKLFPSMWKRIRYTWQANGDKQDDEIICKDKQRKGIDTLLRLNKKIKLPYYSGLTNEVKIDEKNTRTANDRLYIETVSIDYRNENDGWAINKKECHYVAYNKTPHAMIYFVNYKEQRRALLANLDDWKRRFGEEKQPNKDYNSKSIPIPIDILKKHINDIRIIDYRKYLCPKSTNNLSKN